MPPRAVFKRCKDPKDPVDSAPPVACPIVLVLSRARGNSWEAPDQYTKIPDPRRAYPADADTVHAEPNTNNQPELVGYPCVIASSPVMISGNTVTSHYHEISLIGSPTANACLGRVRTGRATRKCVWSKQHGHHEPGAPPGRSRMATGP